MVRNVNLSYDFINFFNPPSSRCLLVIILFILQISNRFEIVKCQYIVHFNGQGIVGNISFDAIASANQLVIEATLEDLTTNSTTTQIIGSEEQLIQFEWSIHKNILSPSSIIKGSCLDNDDELGANIKIYNLNEDKLIVLNRVNSWTLVLDKFLESHHVKSLGSLIWGRSLVVKFHRKKTQNGGFETTVSESRASPGSSHKSVLAPAGSKPPTQSFNPIRSSVALKPHLNGVTAAPTATPTKPVFAPRPKPQISAKFKPNPTGTGNGAENRNQSNVLMAKLSLKAESLVLDQNEGGINLSDNNSTSNGTGIGMKPTEQSAQLENAKSLSKPISQQVNNTDHKSDEKIQKEISNLYGPLRLCGNIIDTRDVKTAEAVFESSIAGRVTLRGNEDGLTLILVNLYHLKSKLTSRFEWKILASDILDDQLHDEKCKHLHILFNPNNLDEKDCTRDDTSKCPMGDLTKKHGQIAIAGQAKSGKQSFYDINLPLSALEGSRSLYLAIYDQQQSIANQSAINNGMIRSSIVSCARIRPLGHRLVEAQFSMEGVRGSIKIQQRYLGEPATISYDLFGLEGNIKHINVRSLPLGPRTSSDNSNLCSSLGRIYDPYKSGKNQLKKFEGSSTTIDRLPVGALSAKFGELSVLDAEYEDHYKGEFRDLSIQLFGPNTIVGRSIAINKNNNDEPWVCANLDHNANVGLNYAVANFYYPVVGRVLFQQLAHEPHSETGVLVDVYNPNGDQKFSEGHNWLIHVKESMADFYNWSERCQSVGDIFDPLQAGTTSNELYSKQCLSSLQAANEMGMRCKLGDTSLKSGLKLSLAQSQLDKTRLYYTDNFLPLSGPNSIIARSVVIYDENSPTQRGNRLACSTIKSIHPLKASVRSWTSGPSIPSNVRGAIQFEQALESKPTQVKMDLSGFNGNVENYAIHSVWTMDDKEFPCSNDSLYDIYDPYDNENSLKLPPSAHYGALATDDRVKVGDLSRKYGTFEGQQGITKQVYDLNAPLFAPKSIIGRSIILRASVNDFRWVCGNIELDYDKGDARQLIGLASFDEPRSKISGFVRFFQLEYKDSSLSDTYMQIDLRLQSPSSSDRDAVMNPQHELEVSVGHNWAVFVNQVGEDAFIGADDVRCIAAGFKWNPYLAQDSQEFYPSSCNPSSQQACAMGDLGMRHGPLTLGPNHRKTLSDSNLPLVGNYSIMGRSLVIFDAKKPNVKLACANIYPDQHLITNVVIKRTPSFTVARFVEQMRTLLGAAEWLMIPDLRATKSIAGGECVQMTIHFYGQRAHQIQSELNNLIAIGTVRKSTRFGYAEKISTHFKLCRISETKLTSGTVGKVEMIRQIDTSYCILLIVISLASLMINMRIIWND